MGGGGRRRRIHPALEWLLCATVTAPPRGSPQPASAAASRGGARRGQETHTHTRTHAHAHTHARTLSLFTGHTLTAENRGKKVFLLAVCSTMAGGRVDPAWLGGVTCLIQIRSALQ